jgi:hypothetical protein
MKRNTFYWYLMDSIFLIVFNLYFFLLKGIDHPPSVWISYVSIHLAYLMLLTTPYLVTKGSSSADYGRPLFEITTVYFFLSLIVGVIFIAIAPTNATVALLVQITIAALFAVLLLTNLIANEHTVDNLKRHEIELKYVKESSSKLDALQKQITDKTIRSKVEEAYDLIHSSPTKSSTAVKTIEQEVTNEICNLEIAVKQSNLQSIPMIMDKICHLANERNRQLKLLN